MKEMAAYFAEEATDVMPVAPRQLHALREIQGPNEG
jgi:hypothetical protein